jgi:hypothetical protein
MPIEKGKCAGLLGVEKVVNISSLAFVRERERERGREGESNLTLDEIRDGKTECESWEENRSMTLSSSPLFFAGACFSDFISF